MSIKESIDLFNSKINQTYWTEQIINSRTRVVLPTENYYKILQKPFNKVGENSGTCEKYHTNNFAEYYANPKSDETIAVVNSVTAVNSIPTKVSIATYYDYNGQIAILNRFDQTGRAHDNDLNVYGVLPNTPEHNFYKQYLADIEFTDKSSGKTRYQADVPHMHFNTRSQTLAFNDHDKANAISIAKLIEYLKDLKSTVNPSACINNLDMGMPFLDLKKAKLTYTSTMISALQNIVTFFDAQRKIQPDRFSEYEKETIDLMKSLINITPDSPSLSSSYIGGGPTSGGPTPIPTSNLTTHDFKAIIHSTPPLDSLNIVELHEVKSLLSKIIKQTDPKQRSYRDNSNDVFVYNDKRFELAQEPYIYKSYLKYVKGLINLESISMDLNKYMSFYKILNERDPLMMSFVSKELLKNLTSNIKPTSAMEKGGVDYESQQPH